MRNEETLLDMANTNYKTSQILLENRQDDERILCSVGYHLQQTVELAIKHFLEEDGVRYGYIHDITQLIIIAKENHVDTHISEYIDEHSEMFTSWEAKTRYIKGFRLELRKIETAMAEVGKYLDVCRRAYEQELEQIGKDESDEQDEALSEEPVEDMDEI